MKTLYFDLIGGISGDMSVASLLDLGVSFEYLRKELKKINVSGYTLKKCYVERGHVKALKFDVIIHKNKNHSYNKIKALVKSSKLSPIVKENISKVYEALSRAETKVHGHKHQDLRFEQLGDIDSIIDIASVCICLERLGVKKISYSVIPVNYRLAPATFELLRDKNIYFTGELFENITPTGMAILCALGRQEVLNRSCLYEVRTAGYGAGSFNPLKGSNALRVAILEMGDFEFDEVSVLEANIDDMNPQVFEYVFEKLFENGALDAFITQVVMKKSRPGFLLTVLSKPQNLGNITRIVLSETTSMGVRFKTLSRLKLPRRIEEINFRGLKARIKVIGSAGEQRFAPEYEDCKAIAKKTGMTLMKVYEEIKQKALGK